MKKYILPLMSIAMMMAMASCSSSDDAVAENNTESKLVQMTFTATQESNVSTRTALTSKRNVIWKSGDAISVFDNTNSGHNHKFILSSGDGNTTGSFTGEVEASSGLGGSYISVYPYNEGAELGRDGGRSIYYVSDMMLPSTQTAIKDSFDPAAALMIAESSDKNQINFKNAVSLVKIKTEFDCKRIVLNANEYIAGKGKLYAKDNPDIEFTSDQSKSIVLKPATEGGDIAAGTYYIAVKPGALTAGWSISFTSTDYNVYTRVANNGVTFNRGNIRSIGSFSTSGTWTSTSRGFKVNANQEVDLGLTITKSDGKKYRVIFAKYNLTRNGLAEKESDYGDYFAWGATEPWYNNINCTSTSVTVDSWKDGKSDGYTIVNAPFYNSSNSSYYDKYQAGESLEKVDDAAQYILQGDWQLPTKDIWQALYDAATVDWGDKQNVSIDDSGIKGMKITKKNDPSGTFLFLPAAGYIKDTDFSSVGINGYYWSCLASSNAGGYRLFFKDNYINPQSQDNRYYGLTIRPVRLVAE